MAVTVFRRPNQTASVLESIRRYEPKRLFVIADGPRTEVPEDVALVDETRSLFDSLAWDCEVVRIFAPSNMGLRRRMESGLDAVFGETDFCIVLEDDCLPVDSFFLFCEELRERFNPIHQVGLIAGFNFAKVEMSPSYFFSRSAFIWGWATWGQNWRLYRNSAPVTTFSNSLLKEVRRTYSGLWEWLFNERLLVTFAKHDSWAIPFSVFLRRHGFINVVPKHNLINNVGNSSSGGTHSFMPGWDKTPQALDLAFPLKDPEEFRVVAAIERLIWRQRGMSLVTFFFRHPWALFRRLSLEIKLWSKR